MTSPERAEQTKHKRRVPISRQESGASGVQHEAPRAYDSPGTSGGPVRVSGGNLQAMGKPRVGNRWSRRPCSCALRIVEEPSVEEIGRRGEEG